MAVGAGFALQRSGRRATLAAGVAVAGVVASAVFAGSLDRLGREQERWGWVADFSLADVDDTELARLVADPALSSVQTVDTSSVRLGDRFADALALVDRKGTQPPVLLTGRLPRTDGELVVGAQLARERGLSVGDVVPVGDDRRPHRVTGVAVLAITGTGQRAGTAVLMTPADLTAAAATASFREATVQVADRSRVDAVRTAYAAELEVVAPEPSVEVRTLGDLRRLPHVLQAGLLGAVLAGLAHVLLQAAGRRRRRPGGPAGDGADTAPGGHHAARRWPASSPARASRSACPSGCWSAAWSGRRSPRRPGWPATCRCPSRRCCRCSAGCWSAALVVALLPARRAARVSPAAALRDGVAAPCRSQSGADEPRAQLLLGHEGHRPAAADALRQVGQVVGRAEDDRGARPGGEQQAGGLDTAHAGHPHVHQHQVRGAARPTCAAPAAPSPASPTSANPGVRRSTAAAARGRAAGRRRRARCTSSMREPASAAGPRRRRVRPPSGGVATSPAPPTGRRARPRPGG